MPKRKKMTLYVDPERGPYKSIQSAVNDALPNSTILIASGLYKDNIIIR
jgi:pectin methylesterase-like acyl-CoA thioesterase